MPLPVPPLGQSSRCGEMAERGPALAGDLRRVAELLDKLGGELANDPEVVTRHGIALQGLDISSQLVAVIEAIIAEDHEVGVGPVKLQALRRSADQALERGAPADHDQASAS